MTASGVTEGHADGVGAGQLGLQDTPATPM